MAMYSIEMNTLSSSGNYDQLYPQTLLSNVSDWNNSIYDKEEIDDIVNEVNIKIDSVPKNFVELMNSQIIFGPGTSSGTLALIQSITNFRIIIIFIEGSNDGGLGIGFFGESRTFAFRNEDNSIICFLSPMNIITQIGPISAGQSFYSTIKSSSIPSSNYTQIPYNYYNDYNQHTRTVVIYGY